jgi:hypothetical protein
VLVIPKAAFCHDLHQITFVLGWMLPSTNALFLPSALG